MLLIRRNGHAVPDVFNRLYYTTLQVQIQEIWDKFQQIVYSIFIGWAAQKKRQLQKLSLLYVLAPLVAVGGVLQQNVMGAALDNGGGGDQRQLGLLTQLRDRQRTAARYTKNKQEEFEMNTEAAMELQMRLAKEALAMLVIHPTFDVQLYRESIMEIGEAWELPADATLEALALIEHERLAIQKAGEGGVVQHILPEEELPMHATGTETLDNVWDLFETSLRTESTKGRTVLYNMARTLEETQNLLDWIEKTEEEKQV